MIELFVLCRSEEYSQRWTALAEHFPDIQILPRSGYRSYYTFIQDMLRDASGDQIILCHDDIWIGKGFGARLSALIEEVTRLYPNWGVVGNAGICPKGETVYRFLRDPHGGPMKVSGPKPVLGVDGNMMLLNRAALRERAVEIPDAGGFHGYDIVLSLETLRAGLLPLVDPRLMVYHTSAGDGRAFGEFIRKPWIIDYLKTRFINHALPTLNDLIHLAESQNYRYLLADHKENRQDFVALFDRALIAAREYQRPSLTIFCRSMLDRSDMITRAMQTFAVAIQGAESLLEIRVVMITHQPQAMLDAELARLKTLLPELPLVGWRFDIREGRYSRADLLLQAFEFCATDYAWFVDDDDFVYPAALIEAARHLAPGGHVLLVGDSIRFEERWEEGSTLPVSVREHSRTRAEELFATYAQGDNFVPICAAIFPAAAMRGQIKDVAAAGDYYEDFYLLMLAFSAPGVELVTPPITLSGISVRGEQNTITQRDRTHWNLSYATFMGELLNHPQSGSPAFWRFARQAHLAHHPNVPLTAYAMQRLPKLVRYFAHIGFLLNALRKVARDPELLRILWRKMRDVYHTQGLKALLVKMVHFGQR